MATPDSTIESEYRAAVEFARNCLKVLGILDRDDLDPDDEAILRIAILIDNVPVILPRDPRAQAAVTLARRYRRGGNTDDLDTLIEKADDHWSYGVALEVIWTWVWATSQEIPPVLATRIRNQQGEKRKPNKSRKGAATRNHLVGMVVEAMVSGTTRFVGKQDNESEGIRVITPKAPLPKFHHLRPTRNDTTLPPYSIIDAVGEALRSADLSCSYSTVKDAWKDFRGSWRPYWPATFQHQMDRPSVPSSSSDTTS